MLVSSYKISESVPCIFVQMVVNKFDLLFPDTHCRILMDNYYECSDIVTATRAVCKLWLKRDDDLERILQENSMNLRQFKEFKQDFTAQATKLLKGGARAMIDRLVALSADSYYHIVNNYVQQLMDKWGPLQYYRMSFSRAVEKDGVLQYCYTGEPLNAVYFERVGSYDPTLFDNVIFTNGKYVRSQWTCNLMHMDTGAKQIVSCLDAEKYSFMMLPYSAALTSTYLSQCAADLGLLPLVRGVSGTPSTYVKCVPQTHHLVYSSADELTQSQID